MGYHPIFAKGSDIVLFPDCQQIALQLNVEREPRLLEEEDDGTDEYH